MKATLSPFAIPLVATVVWAVGILWLIWPSEHLASNDWADVFSGVLAPVSIFWVIYAVHLQSKDLALNREALFAQAQEAKALALEARAQAEFTNKQTDVFQAELALSLHREFVSLMPERLEVWKRFEDPSTRVGSDDGQFWQIVGFFQRMDYLVHHGHLDPMRAGELVASNAWWWHHHFFTHNRCALCAPTDLKGAIGLWDKIHAAYKLKDQTQINEWAVAALSYGNPRISAGE
ncbi:hypothetical protein [Rhizobium sp.]|uniref:hypothetical protein n=1 Tax=Rhizobium sp. TaxID=391 RepID=UPI000DC01018